MELVIGNGFVSVMVASGGLYISGGVFGQIEAVSVEAQELISKNSTGKN